MLIVVLGFSLADGAAIVRTRLGDKNGLFLASLIKVHFIRTILVVHSTSLTLTFCFARLYEDGTYVSNYDATSSVLFCKIEVIDCS